jgi:DNA-binding NarL/FixJ family response regulator
VREALILEDYPETRELLTELLREAFGEINITAVGTLTEARANLKDRHYNLALIDISLPDGSGIDLIHEFAHKSPDTYCVVATIFDDDEHLFPALQAGAHGYLLKEQPRDQLVTLLKRILSGEPPLSPAIARRVLQHFHARDDGKPDTTLSTRETEVLTLIAKGMNRSEIARLLGISVNTASGYIKTIYQKLNVSSRAEATLEASRLGLVRARGPD